MDGGERFDGEEILGLGIGCREAAFWSDIGEVFLLLSVWASFLLSCVICVVVCLHVGILVRT